MIAVEVLIGSFSSGVMAARKNHDFVIQLPEPNFL